MAALVGWLGATGACSTNSLTAKGGACFQSIDCQDGLVCKNLNDAGGTCTDDLTGTVFVPDATAGDAAAQQDVTVTDAPADVVQVQDTGTQDTGTQDTGTQDTGVQDTGAQDTGTD